MEQVDAQAQGEMELVRGEVLARKSDVQLRVVMVFQAPNAAEPSDPPAEPGQPAPANKTFWLMLSRKSAVPPSSAPESRNRQSTTALREPEGQRVMA